MFAFGMLLAIWTGVGFFVLVGCCITSPSEKMELKAERSRMSEDELYRGIASGLLFSLLYAIASMVGGPLWLTFRPVREQLKAKLPDIKWHLGLK